MIKSAIFAGTLLAGFSVTPAYADVNPHTDENLTSTIGAAAKIKLPIGTDDYPKLVARAAARDETVDFRALRFSHLVSPERVGGHFGPTDEQEALQNALKGGDDQAIENAAITFLSEDYTDGFAHTYLMMACDHLHDVACFKQEQYVSFGLLRSILASGDGKTCDTGWDVATVHEEYFILATKGAKMKLQSLTNGSHPCDALAAEDHNGNSVTYWFKIDAVLKDEMSALGDQK